jgi:hypothetical protein
LDDLDHQAAANAVVFAILEVSTKIGRHFWRHQGAAGLSKTAPKT